MGENLNGLEDKTTTRQGLKTIDGRGFRKPGVVQVCILFSITIVLFIFIGYRVQARELYSGLLITEFGLIMLPALIFLLAFRFNLKAVLRLNGSKPLNFIVTFGIMLFAVPLASAFNLLNLLLVNSIFGKVIIQQPPVAQNGKELLVNILVIAGSAGLCEEFLFRGVIQRGFERFGAVRAILLSAFLFSLTHMDFQKVFGTFLLGALIGFIVYKTDSLYCGMFAHFTNNALAVLIGYASAKLMSIFQSTGMNIPEETDLNTLFSNFSALPPQQLVIVLFIYGFIFLCIAVVFILLLYSLIRMNPGRRGGVHVNANIHASSNQSMIFESSTVNSAVPAIAAQAPSAATPSVYTSPAVSKGGMMGLLWLLPGILLIACIYYFEVYNFTGTENELIEVARRLLGS